MLQRHSTDLAIRSSSLILARCIRLKCFVKSPGLANDLVRFSNSKLCSPKQRKHMVSLFSVNANNIAALSACFSVLAAPSCWLVSINGVRLALLVDGLLRG